MTRMKFEAILLSPPPSVLSHATKESRKKSEEAQISRTRVSVISGRPAMRILNKLIGSPYPEIYEK